MFLKKALGRLESFFSNQKILIFTVFALFLIRLPTYVRNVAKAFHALDFQRISTWIGIFILVVFLYAFKKLYCFIFQPFNIVKLAEDVGYGHLKSRNGGSRAFLENLNNILKRRKIGDVPPIYPNGWFMLEESRNIKRNQVTDVHCLGENFAVYRGADGETRILDAYCPHLGANLGVGGIVTGNCLQCPFHGWEFNGQGVCEKIPGLEKVPNGIKTKTWNCYEINGMIFVWYHCENDGPDWNPPAIIESRKIWKYCGRTEHYVNSHIQDLPENAGDVAHLNHLHIPPFMSGSDLRYTFTRWWTKVFQHKWNAKWTADEAPNAHMSTMFITHKMLMFGKEIFFMTADVFIKQIGPGLVYLTLKNKVFGNCVIIMSVTPQESMQQRVVHTFYADSWWCKIFARITCITEMLNFERDVMVWNHKKYISRPIYAATDKLIRGHRKWFQQFYTDNSPRYSFQSDGLDW